MPTFEPIRVTGLKEFVKGLKKLDADLPKQVRLANNSAAALVARYAAAKVPTGPAKGGHVKSSIKAQSTRTAARVSAGGGRFGYYPWLDFGGSVGRGGKTKRRVIKGGRYIYPALSEHYGEIYKTYVYALLDVAKSAGIEMENG